MAALLGASDMAWAVVVLPQAAVFGAGRAGAPRRRRHPFARLGWLALAPDCWLGQQPAKLEWQIIKLPRRDFKQERGTRRRRVLRRRREGAAGAAALCSPSPATRCQGRRQGVADDDPFRAVYGLR